mgnify:CR=1 FL=1|tara:strand:- start:38 stop:460 length:423 start_codon:yes stop_codon:yes gene_type:complete
MNPSSLGRSTLVFTSSARNNGQTNVPMGTPFKPATMNQGSVLTNAKHVYLQKGGGGANFYDASDVIAQKRRMAIGKNTTRVTVPMGQPSSNANFVQNDVKSALAKVRGGGAVAPPKKGLAAKSGVSTWTHNPVTRKVGGI